MRGLLQNLMRSNVTVSTEVEPGHITLIGSSGQTRSVPQTAPLARPLPVSNGGPALTKEQAVEIFEEALEFLADNGFYVTTAQHGKAAIARLERNKIIQKVIQPCTDRIILVDLEKKIR
jgi:hypothetical protein